MPIKYKLYYLTNDRLRSGLSVYIGSFFIGHILCEIILFGYVRNVWCILFIKLRDLRLICFCYEFEQAVNNLLHILKPAKIISSLKGL